MTVAKIVANLLRNEQKFVKNHSSKENDRFIDDF